MISNLANMYEKYYKDLYSYIYMMTLNSFDTEDIIQNTFIKAMLGLKGFKGKSSIRTWLFSISRNECINFLSKRKKEIPLEQIDCIVMENNVEKIILEQETTEKLLKFIQATDEPVKSLLVLRLLQERSFVEIGSIINRSDVWCRTNFFRIKNKLICLLEQK